MKAGLKATAALALLVGAFAVTAGPAAAGGDGDGAAKRGGCDLSRGEQGGDLGADYVYSLKATNLSCGKAKSLVSRFHECRHDNGGADGKCKKVAGYRCKQKELDSSPTLLQAKAKCKKGSKKFVQTFGETL